MYTQNKKSEDSKTEPKNFVSLSLSQLLTLSLLCSFDPTTNAQEKLGGCVSIQAPQLRLHKKSTMCADESWNHAPKRPKQNKNKKCQTISLNPTKCTHKIKIPIRITKTKVNPITNRTNNKREETRKKS